MNVTRKMAVLLRPKPHSVVDCPMFVMISCTKDKQSCGTGYSKAGLTMGTGYSNV